MTDEELTQAMAELQEVVRCRCDEAYRDRGLHDPQCECDSAEAVKIVADRIKALTKERDSLLAGHRALNIGGARLQDRAETAEAKLAKVVEALTPSGYTKAAYMGEVRDPETKRLVSWTAIKMTMKMIMDRAALAEIKGESQDGMV